MVKKITASSLLKKARKESGMSQAEFAKKFGVSASAVCRWENGTRSMPNEVFEFIMQVQK
jgi:transcriptional regulator with XRE-family HTH domain